MENETLLIVGISLLSALSVAAVCMVFLAPSMDRQTEAKRRMDVVTGGARAKVGSPQAAAQHRRKQVAETLKEIEEKQKAELKKKKQAVTLRMLLEQAGLEWDVKTFWMVSIGFGLAAYATALAFKQPPMICLGIAFVCTMGLPRWFVTQLKKRRVKKFTDEFANSLDVIVRGVRSGLPVNECLQIISNEAPKPVCDEFRMLVESQYVGMDLDQALERLYERMPTAEVNFFSIVLNIQRKTGGNLAEALSNLSKVLRERKQLRAKVQSMSAEAKAGALIIGSLPPLVGTALFFISDDYMNLLFETTIGHFLLGGSAVWMLTGVLVMRAMINFKI